MEEIIIRIGKDGRVNFSVKGIKGKSCKDITKAMEKAMGIVAETKSTNEAYEQEQNTGNKQSLGKKTW